MAATIKILLSEPQEFYVPGDTILGRVILSSPNPSNLFTGLSVELWCEEYYNTSVLGKYSRRSLTVPAKENYGVLLEQCDTNGCTQVDFGFTIVLNPITALFFPPSFSLKAFSGGVSWKVVAKAHLKKKFFTLNAQNVVDTHLIEFHPDAIIHPRVYHLTGLVTSRRLKLCHCEVGCYLPQRPSKFIIRLKFDVPQECCLKLCLQKKVVIKGECKAEVRIEHITLAKRSKVQISETCEPIELSCQLEKREPREFSSNVFHIQYKLSINITGDRFSSYGEAHVNLVPPLPDSRLSQKLLEELKTQTESLSIYSKCSC